MKKNRSLWPFALITAFAIFISGTAGLIVLACSQRSELVSAEYYQQELDFQNHLDQLHRGQAAGGTAGIVYDAKSGLLNISLPEAQPGRPIIGRIQLYRPSSAGLDRTADLDLDEHGLQAIDVHSLQPGLWRVRVSWSANGKDFFLEQKMVLPGRKTLGGSSEA